MTVDEIRAMVRVSTMVDSGEISDAELLTFINEGIFDVSMRDNWPWLQATTTLATVAGTESYAYTDLTASEELQEVFFIQKQNSTDDPLYPTSHKVARARWGDDDDQGEPTTWYIYQERVYFHPIPDAVYTYEVDYVSPPAELTAASDEPAWLTTFHHLLVDYVEGRVWQQQEDFVKAQVAFTRYFDRIDTMRRAYAKRVNVGPWAVGAGRSPITGQNEPFRSDWNRADVS